MVLAIDHRANDGAQAAAFLRSSRPGSRPSGRRRLSTEPGAVDGSGAPEPAIRRRPSVDRRAGGPPRASSTATAATATTRCSATCRPAARSRSSRGRDAALGLDIDPSAGRVAARRARSSSSSGSRRSPSPTGSARVGSTPGPGRTRRSSPGHRLAGCPAVPFREDVYFPSWIRFEGKLYRWSDALQSHRAEQRRHRLPAHRLHATATCSCSASPTARRAARAGPIMIRQGTSPVGANYVLSDCA